MAATETTKTARRIARAETVGSLVRPDAIREQLNRTYDNLASVVPLRSSILPQRALELAELNRLADATIREVVQRQIDLGLDVVSDGEMRRTSYVSSIYDAVEGLHAADGSQRHYDDDGNLKWDGPNEPVVTGRVRKVTNPAAEEVTFLRSITDYPFKITLSAPSYFLSDFLPIQGGYEQRAEFAADIVQATREIVAELVGLGARWIQFDFPLYPALVDNHDLKPMLEASGETVESLLAQAIAADNAVIADIPDGVTTALHLCRGNIDGGGFWDGSILPIAEQMYAELNHDRFLFEWEDVARDGDYEPIKFVPPGKVMSIGLVSTKRPEVEDEDELVRQLEEASQHLDIEQLAIGTQCGFACLCEDNRVQADDSQWRKIEVIGRVADRVWGAA
jgi:5-methyltetrahydropteroyltriglutamate--homocysteine methyltransferase